VNQRTENRERRTSNLEPRTSNLEPLGGLPIAAACCYRKTDMAAERSKCQVSVRGELCLTSMGQSQPGCQLPGRFFGSRPVERHHGRRHPRQAAQLGAPAVADRRHLDLVRTACDRLFEMMNGHNWGRNEGVDFTQASHAIKRNGSRRDRPQVAGRTIIGRSRRRKKCNVRFSTGFSRFIHRFSTHTQFGSAL